MSEYDRMLDELNTDSIASNIINSYYGRPINEIYNLIQEAYILNTSNDWFNGDVVLLYPHIRECHATKPYYSIHEAFINTNSLYINYHALLINVTTNTKYILNPSLKFEVGDEIPQTIMDLEDLNRKVEKEITIKKVLSRKKRRTNMK